VKRALLVLATMAAASVIQSYAVTAACSLEPAVAAQEVAINGAADEERLRQEPTIAVLERYAERLGYSQGLRRIEMDNRDNDVAVTIYMPDICSE